MRRIYLLPAAYVLDQVAGDPEWFPHPVRGMGWAIARGERMLRLPGDGAALEVAKGAVLVAGVVGLSYWSSRALIRSAYAQSCGLGWAMEILLAWTCVAAKNLEQEARAVSDALELGDLALARQRLARIVGRDTESLDAQEISRALIETLAESASDGVVAPLLWMAVGGVPAGMAYKAINTMDSMIGHRDERYLYFGKAAARLDDAANFVPARVTALCTVGAAAPGHGCDARDAWVTWRRDGGKHKSPNAGQPEAAMAGALQVRLGGANRYDRVLVPGPRMGEEFGGATPAKARRAIRLTAVVGLLGLGVGVALAALAERRRG